MARRCTICDHAKRDEIDACLVSNETLRDIAGRYGLKRTSLHRHQEKHLPAQLVQAQEIEEVVRADNLLGQLLHLQKSALAILKQAEGEGSHRTALYAIKQAGDLLALQAKLTGHLSEAPIVNVTVNQQWLQIRAVVVEALAPYPEARAAVVAALTRVDDAGF